MTALLLTNPVMTAAVGLCFLFYLAWSAYTIYFVVMLEKLRETRLIGRLLYYHGLAWIVGLIAVAILTLTLVFATVVTNWLRLQGVT